MTKRDDVRATRRRATRREVSAAPEPWRAALAAAMRRAAATLVAFGDRKRRAPARPSPRATRSA